MSASPTLKYFALGGLGEIGMNMWALEWEGRVLVVDAGLMFPQEDMLGVDLVLPDISHLLETGRQVVGIVLTHGHEDHIGGLPFVLQKLNVPVYGTRLTLGLVRPKLKEHRVLREADLREVRTGDRVQLGPFAVETVAVCHSIPDAVGLSIDTPVGRVVYTGDFKLDSAPLDGRPTDLRRFSQLGSEGVLLLLSDSTNAERAGHSGSERDLVAPFEAIFEEAPARIVVSIFASNIYRIQQVVNLAQRHGRRLAIVGRSIQTNFRTAQELGYLDVPPGLVVPRLEDAEAESGRLVILAAGSQGEPLSALSRFAAQRHNFLNVREGDWVVLSANAIPGNERLVHRVINNLYRHGARVFYSEQGHVHVSGHAYREELKLMLSLIRPRYFIPVHGEYRQLRLHADLAREVGLTAEQVTIVEDGQTVELIADGLSLGERVSVGVVYVDGIGIGDVEEFVLRDRRILAQDGVVLATVVVDHDTGLVRAGPELVSRGLIERGASEDLMEEAARAARAALRQVASPDPDLLKEAVREAVSRTLCRRIRRRPRVLPLITGL